MQAEIGNNVLDDILGSSLEKTEKTKELIDVKIDIFVNNTSISEEKNGTLSEGTDKEHHKKEKTRREHAKSNDSKQSKTAKSIDPKQSKTKQDAKESNSNSGKDILLRLQDS